MRATTSAAPPAAKVLTMRTGRAGHASACAGAQDRMAAASAAAHIATLTLAPLVVARFTGASFCSNSGSRWPREPRAGAATRSNACTATARRGRGKAGSMPDHQLPRIAIATGDPAGIGPEVSLKAALDPQVRKLCRPLVVGDAGVIRKHADAADIAAQFHVISDVADARWHDDTIELLAVPFDNGAALAFGVNDAAYGRATLASAARAIAAARAGEVDAVVAAPHNQTSIAAAGIAFDGYPSFVARETGMNHHDVFLMLCFGDTRIVHCTLHLGVAQALTLITRERVGRTIRAGDAALRRIGIARPRLCVGGLNPHAGEGGLFGREEIDTIAPAIADAQAAGIAVE